MLIELEASGADIVGFEHAAETAEDKEAIAAAEARLSDPLSLFALSADAGCVAEEAAVTHEVAGGHSDEGHDDGHIEDSHSEFHARYRLRCENPEMVEQVTFTYFEHFQGAQELAVNVVSEAGQSRYEVGRDDPVLTLDRN